MSRDDGVPVLKVQVYGLRDLPDGSYSYVVLDFRACRPEGGNSAYWA